MHAFYFVKQIRFTLLAFAFLLSEASWAGPIGVQNNSTGSGVSQSNFSTQTVSGTFFWQVDTDTLFIYGSNGNTVTSLPYQIDDSFFPQLLAHPFIPIGTLFPVGTVLGNDVTDDGIYLPSLILIGVDGNGSELFSFGSYSGLLDVDRSLDGTLRNFSSQGVIVASYEILNQNNVPLPSSLMLILAGLSALVRPRVSNRKNKAFLFSSK
jgi:hypothetical protein